jgi:hypothetical protein
LGGASGGIKGDIIDLWAAVKKLSLREAALDLIGTFHFAPGRLSLSHRNRTLTRATGSDPLDDLRRADHSWNIRHCDQLRLLGTVYFPAAKGLRLEDLRHIEGSGDPGQVFHLAQQKAKSTY